MDVKVPKDERNGRVSSLVQIHVNEEPTQTVAENSIGESTVPNSTTVSPLKIPHQSHLTVSPALSTLINRQTRR